MEQERNFRKITLRISLFHGSHGMRPHRSKKQQQTQEIWLQKTIVLFVFIQYVRKRHKRILKAHIYEGEIFTDCNT